MFNRILLASDGSEHSVRAAKKAVELAKLSGDSEITVVYVVDGQTSKEDVLHNTDRTVVEEKRKIRLQPVTNMLEEASLNFGYERLLGEPGSAIVDYANKNQFDIVVLGSRGLNGLQEMVLAASATKLLSE
ncbi:universal stress protein family [Mesobacillus boroniphilus JCM 21738]|uniref:Universal stress protein family n=1 Tax=Mesobacillus boroniphilus JCM 21738 TaxID=1294265 RepID=W4RPR1_9BACI|nr:universal stress protein family [Mesobacillus boroniphilus JCM 21738]